MKKLVKLLVGSIVSTGLMTGVAAAQSSINTTGPGSTNVITYTTTENIVVTCTNNTNVTNNNTQGATSGSANTSGNTSAGGSTSGSATNNSNTSVNVNGGCPAGATPVATTPTTTTPGQGGGQVSGVSTTAAAAGVAALPETGSSTILMPVGIGAVVLGGLAVIAQLGVSVYRRSTLR